MAEVSAESRTMERQVQSLSTYDPTRFPFCEFSQCWDAEASSSTEFKITIKNLTKAYITFSNYQQLTILDRQTFEVCKTFTLFVVR